MPYSDSFKITDDLILHLDTVFSTLHDPFIESRYTGFLAISAMTVLEIALKTVFIDFSEKKHIVLKTFCAAFFDRINGRIKLKDIGDYIEKFGKKYSDRFSKRLAQLERESLRNNGTSIKSSYGNLVIWRHKFAHEAICPVNATYQEVKNGYSSGKVIIDCLSSCMRL